MPPPGNPRQREFCIRAMKLLELHGGSGDLGGRSAETGRIMVSENDYSFMVSFDDEMVMAYDKLGAGISTWGSAKCVQDALNEINRLLILELLADI